MKNKKTLKIITIICAVIFTICAAAPFAINFIVIKSAKKNIVKAEEAAGLGAEYILVLGARVHAPDVPSHMLEDRILRGVGLWSANAAEKLLMSGDGGNKEGYDEVTTMKNYAVNKGVDEDAIMLDGEGFSTFESMHRAKNVLNIKSAVIVTQGYHLYRAVYIAKHLGIEEVYGVSSDLRPYMNMPYHNTREFLARIKDFYLSNIK
ncbi:MAG: YdcF family protein [Oscillospiraceae bacterium]|nr:YdcF family protein [Oscillospiraceae bacterium]